MVKNDMKISCSKADDFSMELPSSWEHCAEVKEIRRDRDYGEDIHVYECVNCGLRWERKFSNEER
jgi:hypothetical protein